MTPAPKVRASALASSERPWTAARYDVVVVGSGPNGLAAAITAARAGLSTLLIEAHDTVGGGTRTASLTLPGYVHDVCSTVHPMGVASPFFASLPLARHGLRWMHSPALVTHVLDEERSVTLERSVEATAEALGPDGPAYRRLFEPYVARADELLTDVLAGPRFPKSPLLFARFGLHALRSMRGLARRFREPLAPALLAGIGAHSMLSPDAVASASFALVLSIAGHAGGWPVARGGSQAISGALAACFRAMGGEIVTGVDVDTLDALPPARAYLCDVSPRSLVRMAGHRLSRAYRARLARFRHGPGIFKMDWALSQPIPWRDPACARSATVHLGGSLDDVARSEVDALQGRDPSEPFVLLVQPTLVDPSRAPAGKHVAWAYCHVPHGSTADATRAIEARIERFAPGFCDCIEARTSVDAASLERYDANYVGGDIAGGLSDIRQLFFRPVASLDPWRTSAPDVFLCSSSTPPGGGVHGMCGYWAARSALRHVFAVRDAPLPAPAFASASRTRVLAP